MDRQVLDTLRRVGTVFAVVGASQLHWRMSSSSNASLLASPTDCHVVLGVFDNGRTTEENGHVLQLGVHLLAP